ncbi:MAG TPA: tyrosine-type recombinase/integrase [Baekduia sp.]|nr:tyrosine-type recombinase/integrase [Baekduia sp.]
MARRERRCGQPICATACSYRPRIAPAFPGRRFHTLRHTCAAMLIDAGASPLRLQRWMGHHSAAFTLDTYGHLLHDDLGPHLDLGLEIR